MQALLWIMLIVNAFLLYTYVRFTKICNEADHGGGQNLSRKKIPTLYTLGSSPILIYLIYECDTTPKYITLSIVILLVLIAQLIYNKFMFNLIKNIKNCPGQQDNDNKS